jgi:flagellar assembly protein FliH
MTRILKRPADALDSLRLPVRHADSRTAAAESKSPVAQAALPEASSFKAELDALREQAFREGLAQGRVQAEKEARVALEAELQRWRSVLENIEGALQRKLGELEPLGVAIGYEATAALLGDAYADRDALAASVRRLLDAAGNALRLTVRVAPQQLQRVQAAQRAPGGGPRKLQFEADASLGITECTVTSERGLLETSLALQLQAIQDVLLQEFRQRQAAAETA